MGLLTTSCSSSACEKMRDAQDELAEVEQRVEAGNRFPEDAPSTEEIMAAYENAALATDACRTETVEKRGG